MKKSQIMKDLVEMKNKRTWGPDKQVYREVIQYLAEQFKMNQCEECGDYFGEAVMRLIWKQVSSGFRQRREVCWRCCDKIKEANEKVKRNMVNTEEELHQDLGMLRKPCVCGSPVKVYKIDSGAYKDTWVAACPKCDIEYYFENDGELHVVS